MQHRSNFTVLIFTGILLNKALRADKFLPFSIHRALGSNKMHFRSLVSSKKPTDTVTLRFQFPLVLELNYEKSLKFSV